MGKNKKLVKSGVKSSSSKETEEQTQKKLQKLSIYAMAVLSEQQKKYIEDASPEDCIKDLRALQEANPLKFITRNFYRVHGSYSDKTWDRYFGTFLEFRKQAGLELNRQQQQMERGIAKQASLDVFRSFYRDEVLPYENKYTLADSKGRFKTVLVGSDFHDIHCDPFVLAVFLDTAKRLQPDVIVLNGDIFDLYEASRFDQDIRQVKIVGRFNYVKNNIFKPLRELCPNAQIDLIIGNHERRILTLLAAKTPALKVILADVMGLTLADVFGLDEFEINMISKLDLTAFRNEDVRKDLSENFKVYYNCFVASHFDQHTRFGLSGTSGHTHKPKLVTFCNLSAGKMTWTTTGCMARTRMEYVEGLDDSINSFLIAHLDTKKLLVNPEHIVIPGNHVVVHGKRYIRKDDKE